MSKGRIIVIASVLALFIVMFLVMKRNNSMPIKAASETMPSPSAQNREKPSPSTTPAQRIQKNPESKKKKVATPEYMSAFGLKAKESCVKETLGEHGFVDSDILDTDCDGKGEYCRFFSRNEFGDEIESMVDADCDGSIDKCHKSQYDNYGELSHVWMGKSCVAEEGMEICMSNEYDEDEFLIRQSWDFQCTKELDLCLSYEYEKDGLWTKILRDHKCDGKINSCVSFHFNENEQTIAVEQDREFDGKPDLCNYLEYDKNGLLVKKIRDEECRRSSPKSK